MLKQKTEWRIVKAAGRYYVQYRSSLYLLGIRAKGFVWVTITHGEDRDKVVEMAQTLKYNDVNSFEPEEIIPC